MMISAYLEAAVTLGDTTARDIALQSLDFLLATAVYTLGSVATFQVVEARFADGQFRRGGLAGGSMALGGLIGVLAALAHDRSAPLAGVFHLGHDARSRDGGAR